MNTTKYLTISALAILSLDVMPLRAVQVGRGGNAAAAAVKNPVAATPESVRRGRQVYVRACRHCHGENATGDGPLAPKDSPPPNLTDATWDYGSSDGEIFTVIANGIGGDSPMKGMRSILTTRDMWDVVNYLRSISSSQQE